MAQPCTTPHRTAPHSPDPEPPGSPVKIPLRAAPALTSPSPTAQAAVSHRSVFRSRSAAATLGEGGSGGGRGAARGPEAARGDRKRRAAWRGCRCATRPWTAPCARFSVRAARRGAAAGRAARVAALRLPALRFAGLAPPSLSRSGEHPVRGHGGAAEGHFLRGRTRGQLQVRAVLSSPLLPLRARRSGLQTDRGERGLGPRGAGSTAVC